MNNIICYVLSRILRTHIIFNIPSFRESGQKGLVENLTKKITEWHRFVGHITNNDLFYTRQRIDNLNNNEQLRIEYIMGEKTREQLANTLVRNDGTRKKLVELFIPLILPPRSSRLFILYYF